MPATSAATAVKVVKLFICIASLGWGAVKTARPNNGQAEPLFPELGRFWEKVTECGDQAARPRRIFATAALSVMRC
jgi:hypothetical protein